MACICFFAMDGTDTSSGFASGRLLVRHSRCCFHSMRRRRTAPRRRYAFGGTCARAKVTDEPKSREAATGSVSAHACGRPTLGSMARAIAPSRPRCSDPRRVEREAWRTASLRDTTIRLVRDGLRLMRGGYLDLLRRGGRKPTMKVGVRPVPGSAREWPAQCPSPSPAPERTLDSAWRIARAHPRERRRSP